MDVVIEYQGEIREDVFFDMLHENGLSVGGMMVDINPITAEKSGSIEEYLARANQYLEEKVKSFRESRGGYGTSGADIDILCGGVYGISESWGIP